MAIPSGGLNSNSNNRLCISAPRALCSAIMLALGGGHAHALPQGGQVVAGEAAISARDGHMTVQQGSNRAVLEYQSFNVEHGERVQFIQPGADAVALNRVVGNELSNIAGQIDANGQVYLINPNGVMFGQGAQVDVGALVTSTLNVTNEDFMAGRDAFAGTGSGTVHNEGHIQASGDVVLIAPEVINDGVIEAARVALAAGKQVLVNPPGSTIPILIEDAAALASLHNSGEIHAREASLSTHNGTIRNDGLVRAQAVNGAGGSIELVGTGSDVFNSGTLDASATAGNGGRVKVEASRYGQTGSISATGQATGGGGDIDIKAADAIVLQNSARIEANAGETGHGGEVIVYSDNATTFKHGAHIDARGGNVEGDGGFVEVSGRQHIQVAGTVDASAVNGESGLWYIDPTRIEISNAADEGAFNEGSDPWVWEPIDGDTSRINVATLQNALRGGNNVVIDTAMGSGNAADPDIRVETDIDFNGVSDDVTLSLLADNDVRLLNGARIYDSVAGDGDSLNLVMVGRSANIVFSPGSSVDLGAGTLRGRADGRIELGRVITTSAQDDAIQLTTSGLYIGSNGDAGAGIYAPNGGVYLEAGSTVNDGGGLTFEVGRLGFSANSGTFNYNTTGDITITGIRLNGDASFNASTTGNITYLGSESGDWSNATGNVSLTTSNGWVSLNGALGGTTSEAVDFTVNATSGLSMANDASVHVGGGKIDLSNNSGDTRLTGLTSLNGDADAIRLSVASGQLVDPGDVNPVDLAAPNGGLLLNVQDGIYGITVDAQTLDITSPGGGVILKAINDLLVTNLDLNPGQSAELTAAGILGFANDAPLTLASLEASAGNALVIPDAGFNVEDELSLSAPDIRTQSNMRSFSLAAEDITLNTAASGGDLTIATSADTLAVAHTGTGVITITDTDALTLTDAAFASGTLAVATAEGSALTLADELDLDGDNGTLELTSGADLILDSVIEDTTGPVDNSSTITLNARDAIRFESGARVNAGAGVLSLNAGTDIELGRVIGNAVSLLAGAGVSDANGAALNVSAENLTLSSAADVAAAADPLELDIATLSLASTGGSAYLANTNTVSAQLIDVAGDLNLEASSGDIVLLQDAPVIGGQALLRADNGQLVVTDRLTSGDLQVNAGSIAGSGATPHLVAGNAVLTLTDAEPLSLLVDFDNLTLTAPAASSVTVTDDNALTLHNLTTGGSTSLNTTGGDLTLTGATSVAGALALNTLGSGDVVLPVAGLAHSGDLSINADNLADDDNNVSFSAANAQIVLRDASADRLWQTAVNTLSADLAGAGSLTLSNSSALTLAALASGGDVSIVTAGGDLTLAEAPSVSGALNLAVIGRGDVVLPATGLTHNGELSINADNLTDGDNDLSFAATDAQITLRESNADSLWRTTVASLAVDVAGTGNLTVVNTGSLTLTGLNTGADAAITSTDTLSVVPINPAVGGNLTLNAGDSALVISDAGLYVDNGLVIRAGDLSDSDRTVALSAAQADIQLASLAQPLIINSQFGELTLDARGSAVNVNQNGALSLAGLSASDDFDLITSGPLAVNTTTLDTSAAVSLDSGSAEITLASAGLTTGGTLSLAAGNLSDGDGGAITLSASNLALALGNSELELNTAIDTLALNAPSAERLTLSNDRDLRLTQWDAPVLNSISFTVDGLLTILDTGLEAASQLNIVASDLMDSDRTVELRAANLNLQLANPAADLIINGAAEVLDIWLGAGSARYSQSGALTIADLSGDNRALTADNGNLEVAINDGDLIVNGNVEAVDNAADGIRAGRVNLAVTNGNLTVGAEGDASITSSSGEDRATGDELAPGISLQLLGTEVEDRAITLGNGRNSVALRAEGADVFINAKAIGTPDDAGRAFVQHGGAVITAFDQPSDPFNGEVTHNGVVVEATTGQQIGAGRRLAITSDYVPPVAGEDYLDGKDPVDNLEPPGEPGSSQGELAAAQFVKVFGACNETDENNNDRRCRIDTALKSFLSHWLVGGELPPKTEI